MSAGEPDPPPPSASPAAPAPAVTGPAPAHEVAGDVALEITHELAEPTRALRDRLGLVVDHLERHVATSTGPTPYPWRSLQTLRQDLAAAYLEATTLARRLDELDRALVTGDAGWFDVSAAVDHGLRLANHHFAAGIEVLIDLAHAPHGHGVAGSLALLVAQLVAASAGSARAMPGSSLSIRVTRDAGWVVVLIADNGAGSDRAAALGALAGEIVAPWGATAGAASEPGMGCAFELRLRTAG